MLEVYGQLIRAQLQISATDLSPTATGLIYFNTTTGIKWHNGTAWKIAADLDSSQTLTNKTLVQPLIDNYFDINEEAAPGTPAANTVRIYAKADGKLYKKDDTGVESEVGSGAGSTVKNYLQDWFDGTRAIAVSATTLGATSNRTTDQALWARSTVAGLTIENNAVSPLRPLGDFLINSSAATINSFVESPLFAIDSADVGKTIIIEFDLTGIAAITNYDIVVVRYNSAGTYQDTISVAGNASTGTPASAQLPVGTATFSGFFIPSATSTDLYSIRLRKVAAVDDDFQIDSLFVGKQVALQGAIVTQFSDALTPASGWFVTGPTNVTTTVKQARIGSEAHIRYAIIATGTSAAFSELSINLPSNLTIDTTAINKTSNGRTPVGKFELTKPGVGNFTGVVYYEGTSLVCRYLGSTALPTQVSNTSPVNWDTTTAATSINIEIIAPISQWQSGTTTLADRAVEEYAFNTSKTDANDTTSFGNGISGSTFTGFSSFTALRLKRVRFQSPILPSDNLIIEVKADGQWTQISSTKYNLSFTEQNVSSYGIGLRPISGNSTDIDVAFGQYSIANGATYGAAGFAWNNLAGANITDWRVRKVSSGAAVGFPVSTANLTDKNKIQKKTLASTVTATSGATVQIPSLTFNNLVVGKNYRLHMHGYISIFVNGSGGAFSAVHNASQLALIYYEGVASASNRFMAAGTTQLFTAAATTVTFQFANTSGPNGSALSAGTSWVILEELNDTDLSTAFT